MYMYTTPANIFSHRLKLWKVMAAEVLLKFMNAVRSGDLRLVKKLTADDNGKRLFGSTKTGNGATALHMAAAAGQADVLKYLIKHLNLDVNAQNKTGETPLMVATLAGHLHNIVYLLENGADNAVANDMGITPLHFAAFEGNKSLIKLLISYGAEVEVKSPTGTPLICAAQQGNRDAVEALLQHNADPNAFSNLTAPLILSSQASLECTDLLVKAGADPNINVNGLTPIHAAVYNEKVEILLYLLKVGADPNVLDSNGLTPLEAAALLGNHTAELILFPFTSPIPAVTDWSIRGLFKYSNSEGAREKLDVKAKELFNWAKSKGADAFKMKDYVRPIYWYTGAIAGDPSDATLLSNRSLCYALMGIGASALEDAQACVKLRPDWPKAHYREGVAWKILKNYSEAAKSFSVALKLSPDNPEIQKALQEAVEAEIGSMRL